MIKMCGMNGTNSSINLEMITEGHRSLAEHKIRPLKWIKTSASTNKLSQTFMENFNKTNQLFRAVITKSCILSKPYTLCMDMSLLQKLSQI